MFDRVLNMPGFWIHQGSEHAMVLNIPGFWTCQGSEYTRVLSVPGFWIYQGSEYTSVMNTPGFWIHQGSEHAMVQDIPGFWICKGSEHTRVLNMSGLWIYYNSAYASGTEYTTALNMLLALNIPRFLISQGYRGFWICLWICLYMLKYVWVCQNMHESTYIFLNGFCFLKVPQVVFLKRQNLIFSKVE